MISETAIEYLDELVAQGLSPSPRDVVRLNAAGLRLEAASAKNVSASTYLLPRLAAVSPTVFFRQPSVGHEIWLAKIRRFIPEGDYQTTLAVYAFALSRPHTDLPDPDSPAAIQAAVDAYLPTCGSFTRDQLYAAIHYAVFGADPSAGESTSGPTAEDGAADGDDPATPDFDEAVAVGVLNEGRAVLWGATAADLKSMTVSELAGVIDRAYKFHQMERSQGEEFWSGRFYATLDEITARLKSEKSAREPARGETPPDNG